MIRLSAKLVQFGGKPAHWCPGCGNLHPFDVERPNPHTGARWTWDGNTQAPSFSPSMHIDPGGPHCCHYFLRVGVIQFLPDSRHALAGQTVPLPDMPDGYP